MHDGTERQIRGGGIAGFPAGVPLGHLADRRGPRGLTAARQALLAGLVTPAERTRVRAVLQSAINGGIAIGAAAAGSRCRSTPRRPT
jgi:hypothetical protein